eukprot:CAMPEP_0172692398 /NCGR_PEP_ID=MMETSP1074-20121228/25225_1 /TAXON_ID=2916 /ORGANISM="Ceratium fusus, Strain PA161109" /LENGTH=41 /DNA_ID= /DNA_START= /DNA_END= /DNA_ORIENTATION=
MRGGTLHMHGEVAQKQGHACGLQRPQSLFAVPIGKGGLHDT